MSIALRFVRPAVLWLAGAASVRGEIRPEFEMDHDPEIHVPAVVKVFSGRLKPLWLEALARPEADLQRMAAEAIGRAQAAGIADMKEAVPGLVVVLTAPATHPAARLAAARTLVTLDAKETAPRMAESAEKYGADFRQIVEPALADWSYEPHREIWQARLTRAGAGHRDLLLAIRCLAEVRDKSGVSRLLNIVNDRFRSPAVRLEAAQAAGILQDSGLESDARRLSAGGEAASLVNRLCAVKLLGNHAGGDAENLLAQLAVDPEPAVAVMALRRLIAIDPQLVVPVADRALASSDPKVRQCGADTYVLLPDPPRVAALARLLDDPHPSVRGSARDGLCTLAPRPELADAIRREATVMLAGNRWRGLEQAALLLGALAHQPAAGRLVELLEFNRPEVGIAAAWGLKKLAHPDALAAMLDKARRNTVIRNSGSVPAGLDAQTAHLFEAFGRMNYTAGESLLRAYIPKNLLSGELSRSSAIWSLGLLHRGVPDEQLAKRLMERVADDSSGPFNPLELDSVKAMSAVSMARMKAVSQAVPMRRYYDSKMQSNRVTMSLLWAMTDLTGEQFPELPPAMRGMWNWFLEPLAN